MCYTARWAREGAWTPTEKLTVGPQTDDICPLRRRGRVLVQQEHKRIGTHTFTILARGIPYIYEVYSKKMKYTCSAVRDRRFRRNTSLQALCDTSIAHDTGCVPSSRV